jgi:hypothetical protein
MSELEQYLGSLGIEESSSQVYAEYLASGCSVLTRYDLQDKQPSVTQLYDIGITSLEHRLLITHSYVDSLAQQEPVAPRKSPSKAETKSNRMSFLCYSSDSFLYSCFCFVG